MATGGIPPSGRVGATRRGCCRDATPRRLMPVGYFTKKAWSVSHILQCRQTGWRDNVFRRQYPGMLQREPAAIHVGRGTARRSAGVRREMPLIYPRAAFCEKCENYTSNWGACSIWMLEISRCPLRMLGASFTWTFHLMSLMIFPSISLINLFAETKLSRMGWGNLVDFGEQEVYGH